MAEECCGVDDEEDEGCVGRLCFERPHRLYVPPVIYSRIPARNYKWKAGIKASIRDKFQLKLQRVFAFPNCLGLSDDARWRWPWFPLSFLLGMRVSKPMQFSSWDDWKINSKLRLQTTAYARVKAMSTLCGKLALRPVVELLPVPGLSVKRAFAVGNVHVTVSGGVELHASAELSFKGPLWRVRINWPAANSARVLVQPAEDAVTIKYSKQFNLGENCGAVASALAEFPSTGLSGGLERIGSGLPVRLRLGSIKVWQIFSTKAKRQKPASPSAYLKASNCIGSRDVITVVPGHWIDPGYEAGAPGEREFNLEVANVLERKLYGNGWKVLRPDRDAPSLSWEEYLNWVSKQTLRGLPVLEIHGQGSTADYRGLVLGVIGDENAPLSQELAKDFGVFEMDWTDLAVPRRGGVILESFNSEEVLEMAPWQRTCAACRLANRIVACIERASSRNGCC